MTLTSKQREEIKENLLPQLKENKEWSNMPPQKSEEDTWAITYAVNFAIEAAISETEKAFKEWAERETVRWSKEIKKCLSEEDGAFKDEQFSEAMQC